MGLQQFSLEGKIAFVTGAGRGLGRAGALALAEAGADLALVSRTRPQLEESATQVQNLGSLGDLPLVVIKAGIRPADDYPPDAIWDEDQVEIAGLSTNGKLIVAEASDHFVQLEQPDLVVDTVRQVYDETR